MRRERGRLVVEIAGVAGMAGVVWMAGMGGLVGHAGRRTDPVKPLHTERGAS